MLGDVKVVTSGNQAGVKINTGGVAGLVQGSQRGGPALHQLALETEDFPKVFPPQTTGVGSEIFERRRPGAQMTTNILTATRAVFWKTSVIWSQGGLPFVKGIPTGDIKPEFRDENQVTYRAAILV